MKSPVIAGLMFCLFAADLPAQARDAYGDPLPAGAFARIGKLRHQHDAEGTCTGLAVFPDGKRVVSILRSDLSKNATWHLWEADGRPLFNAPTGNEIVRSIAIAPDGHRLAFLTGPDEGRIDGDAREVPRYTIEIWDVPTRKKVESIALGERAVSAILFTDRETVQTVEVVKRSLEIRDARKKAMVRTWPAAGNEIERLTASADGRFLTATALNGPVRIWDAATGKLLGQPPYPGRTNRYQPMTQGWHKDGLTRVATVDLVGSYLHGGKEEWELKRNGFDPLGVVAFAPDGKTLFAAGRTGAISQWDCATGKECTDADRPRGRLDSLSLSPGARFVATGRQHVPGGLRVWEVASGKCVLQEDVGENAKHDFAVDGQFAYAAGRRVFVTATPGKSKPRDFGMPTRPQQFRNLGFSPDGKMLYLITPDGVNRWTVTDGKQLPMVGEFKVWTHYLRYTPDGQGLALEKSDKIICADAATGMEKSVLFDVGNSAERRSAGWGSFQFVSSSQLLVAMSMQSEVRLLDLPTGKPRHVWRWDREFSDRRCGLSPINTGAIAVLPHGQTAIMVPDGGQAALLKTDNVARRSNLIRVIDLASGGIRLELDPRQGHHLHVSLSPDGRFLASGGRDGTVLLWDLYAKQTGPTPTFEQCWESLSGKDAPEIHRALSTLVQQPEQGVKFLQTKLTPARPPIDPALVCKLIAALGSAEYRDRQTASAQLQKLHRQVEPDLRRARAKSSQPLEAQRRIDQLLDDCAVDTPEQMRVRRVLEALEMMQHPAALRLLEALAGGAAEVFPTPEARSALLRMARHRVGTR